MDDMTLELERAIASLTEKHFPLVEVRRRSNEDPWITRGIRRLWKRKIRYYKRVGKSDRWWATEEKLQRAIAESKEEFVNRLLLEGSNGDHFTLRQGDWRPRQRPNHGVWLTSTSE